MDAQGLWDEQDGMYYSAVHHPDGSTTRIPAHSIDGLLPLSRSSFRPMTCSPNFPNSVSGSTGS